jgi:hypothetical protein
MPGASLFPPKAGPAWILRVAGTAADGQKFSAREQSPQQNTQLYQTFYLVIVMIRAIIYNLGKFCNLLWPKAHPWKGFRYGAA